MKSKTAAVRVLAITAMTLLVCGAPRATEQAVWRAASAQQSAVQSTPIVLWVNHVQSRDALVAFRPMNVTLENATQPNATQTNATQPNARQPNVTQHKSAPSLDGLQLAALDGRSAAYVGTPARTVMSADAVVRGDSDGPALQAWALMAAAIGMVIFMTRRRLPS